MTAADTALNLESIASQAIDLARQAGATDAECTIAEGNEFSASVRIGSRRAR